LDVGVFPPLATAHKTGILEISRFGASDYVDKVDFLKVYQLVRRESITAEVIQKAWKSTGLAPFNLQLILEKLPPPPKPTETQTSQEGQTQQGSQ